MTGWKIPIFNRKYIDSFMVDVYCHDSFRRGFLKMLIIESDDFDLRGPQTLGERSLMSSIWTQEIFEPRKKKTYYFPLNPGWLIGIPIMVYCNPYIIEYNPIYTLNSQVFFRGSFGNLLFFLQCMYVPSLKPTWHLKTGLVQKEGSSPNHHFSLDMLVLGSVLVGT